MRKLVTADGWEFYAQSNVHIGDRVYDMEELNDAQRKFVGATLDVQALNAAYAGQAVFRAEGLPPIEDVFPELRKES